jgi:hypothetical protein
MLFLRERSPPEQSAISACLRGGASARHPSAVRNSLGLWSRSGEPASQPRRQVWRSTPAHDGLPPRREPRRAETSRAILSMASCRLWVGRLLRPTGGRVLKVLLPPIGCAHAAHRGDPKAAIAPIVDVIRLPVHARAIRSRCPRAHRLGPATGLSRASRRGVGCRAGPPRVRPSVARKKRPPPSEAKSCEHDSRRLSSRWRVASRRTKAARSPTSSGTACGCIAAAVSASAERLCVRSTLGPLSPRASSNFCNDSPDSGRSVVQDLGGVDPSARGYRSVTSDSHYRKEPL